MWKDAIKYAVAVIIIWAVAAHLGYVRPIPIPHFIYHSYETREGTSPVLVSDFDGPPTYALHVLFIGNSYTFYHDMPQMLTDIASADKTNPTQFFVQSVTRGGIGLKELWEDGNAANLLSQSRWDVVVLQEESFWAMAPDQTKRTYEYAEKFHNLILQNGARPMLALSWPRKPGSHWYTDPDTAFLKNPDFMMKQFHEQTSKLGTAMGAQTAPVGLYWYDALAEIPTLDLYEPDGSHPNMRGSFLSALVFYKTLTGRDVSSFPIDIKGIPPAEITQLQVLVATHNE